MTDHTNASGFRSFIWPIFGKEHKKFLPMTAMISLILFNYTLMRNMKDALFTGATSGSAVIPALKVFAVLPSAFIIFLIISKLYSMYSKEKVFNMIVLFFTIFFALFALVLYPAREFLEATTLSQWILNATPDTTFFTNLANMVRYWSFTFFYIFSELWGSVVASLLFWQFANQIVQVAEAKRFYSHFYLLANLATMMAGYLGLELGLKGKELGYYFTVNVTMTLVVIASVMILGLFAYLTKKVVPDPELVVQGEVKPKKSKPKLSIGESLKFIFSSPYLGLIALLVICYGISINLVEVAWKESMSIHAAQDAIKALGPKIMEDAASVAAHKEHAKSVYQSLQSTVTMWNGLATFFVILVGSYLVRLLGWRFGALATPVIIGITGSVFFYFFIYSDSAAPIASGLGMSVLLLTVTMGAVQNVLSKSTKYALFDPTKEMAYIPLDDESKSKGKAAVDVVGGRLGKAGGAGIQQFLFLFTAGGVVTIAPILAVLMIGFVVIWMFSVVALNKRFQALSHESEEAELAKAKAKA